MKKTLVFLCLAMLPSCPKPVPAVECAAPKGVTTALEPAISGQRYQQTLVAEGSGPILFAASMPEGLEGLRLTESGTLEGTPAISGRFTLALELTNVCGDEQRTASFSLPLIVMSAACAVTPAVEMPEKFFSEVTEPSGVLASFIPGAVAANHNTTHMTEFVDLNNDGFDEVVLHNFFSAGNAGLPYRHLVFRNNQDGTFTDVSSQTGFVNVVAQAFAFGDVDNDGDVDAVTTVPTAVPGAKARVFLNNGDITFSEVAVSGLENSQPFAASVVMADLNNDAKLDLFLSQGYSSSPKSDEMYFGKGDGTFENVTSRLANQVARQTNAAVACDYDNDGDQDLFVAMYGVSHMNGHNVLWQNNGDGTFVNVAEAKGFAYQKTGNYVMEATGRGTQEQPSAPYIGNNAFDLVCEDLNNDGYLDIFIAAISHPDADFKRTWSDPTRILINQGPEADYAFTNEFLARKLLFNEGDIDIAVVDVNNDGRMDLSTQRDNKYESRYTSQEYKGWLGLMLQLTDGTFKNISLNSGINDVSTPSLGKSKGAGGHAWSDFDGDGDMDLLWGGHNYSVTDFPQGRPPALYRNEQGSQNPWLKLRLQGDGVKVNRSAYGARVTVEWPDFQVTRTLNGAFGHWNLANTQTLHFGMAGRSCMYTLRVQWPDGTTATFDGATLGRQKSYVITYPDRIE